VLQRPSALVAIVLTALVVAALLVPFVGGSYAIKFTTRVLVLAIFVISLDFLIGITGLVSFGHAMFFGLGAYSLYFISPQAEAANALVAFPAAILGAGVAAAVIGAFCVLTRGFYFIMVTLAFGQMLFSLFYTSRIAGGSDGAYINVKPEVALFGVTILDFDRRTVFYYFCLAALVLVYLGALALARTPFGRVLQAIRRNEQRVGALGVNTYTHKLLSFVLAGAIAGFAGVLFATIDGYVTPDLFGWRQSGVTIMMVVLGGVGTLFGPILGAAVLTLLSDGITDGLAALGWEIPGIKQVFYGVVLLAVVMFLPNGIWPALARRLGIGR